jgi:hypothetical protein
MKVMWGKARTALPPEQVIGWLRSKQGQAWSAARGGKIYRHSPGDGIFASVLPDPGGPRRQARWPEPLDADELDD